MFEYIKLIYYLIRPKTIFIRKFSNAMGDTLLLTIALQGIRKQNPKHKVVLEAKWHELFKNNPNFDWITDRHIRTTKRHIKPKYYLYPNSTVPIYEQVSKYVSDQDVYYPKMYLDENEIGLVKEKYPYAYIVICPHGKRKFSANRKEWGIDKFQVVRNHFSNIYFIQIGIKDDELLNDVIDARGENIRESALIIKNAMFFIGLEGGLMHIAKAVGARSVIIYGGFINKALSEYNENINISNMVDCSPCFSSEKKHVDCPTMKCMIGINPDKVIQEIEQEFKLM
ncbi:hypothetical protein KJ762_01790 [bacterium]|nr:hypothetical protein [bacterium]MBU1874168.1 hypothetical protein [bacterium]